MNEQKSSIQRKNYYISIIFLIFLLAFCFVIWKITKSHFTNKAEENFIEYSHDIESYYDSQLENLYTYLDFGGSLFNVDNQITRKNFEDFYSETVDGHNKKYDNINFITYVERVTNKDQFEQRIKSEVTDPPLKNIFFSVYPKKDKSEYWVINYMLPNDPNKAYFGYDILSDAGFSDYFKKAAQERIIVVTEPKIFVNNQQILIIKPIYNPKLPIRNGEERLRALNGFSVLFVNPNKLFASLSELSANKYNINIHVYLNHLEESQIATHKPIYEDIYDNLNYLKIDKTEKLENIFYDHLGDKEITIYIDTDIDNQLGPLEGIVTDVIFVTTSILILGFFLTMVDMNYSSESESEK